MSAAAAPIVVGESRWANRAWGLLAWVLGLLFFFPVFWMVLMKFSLLLIAASRSASDPLPKPLNHSD